MATVSGLSVVGVDGNLVAQLDAHITGDLTDGPQPVSGGSSGGLVEYVIPFAFDDPDLLTGKEIYVPTVGDRLLRGSCISVTEAFDGTDPAAYLVIEGHPTSEYLASGGLDSFSVDDDFQGMARGAIDFAQDTAYFTTTDALELYVDDGAGGDPNDPTPMTQGAGEVRLLILPKGTTPP